EDARIRRVEQHIYRPGGVVHEEHFRPRLAAVGAAEHAAVRFRTIRGAERRYEEAIGVGWVDGDARDASRVLEARARPALSGIGRLEHAPADRDVAADVRLAGADVHDVRIRWRDGD